MERSAVIFALSIGSDVLVLAALIIVLTVPGAWSPLNFVFCMCMVSSADVVTVQVFKRMKEDQSSDDRQLEDR